MDRSRQRIRVHRRESRLARQQHEPHVVSAQSAPRAALSLGREFFKRGGPSLHHRPELGERNFVADAAFDEHVGRMSLREAVFVSGDKDAQSGGFVAGRHSDASGT